MREGVNFWGSLGFISRGFLEFIVQCAPVDESVFIETLQLHVFSVFGFGIDNEHRGKSTIIFKICVGPFK